jgi:hypothetical protein
MISALRETMKRLFYFIILFLAISFQGLSQSPLSQSPSYKVGEKVYYTIHYGFINGGNATLELVEDTLDDKIVWHSKLVGRTTGFSDALFRVLDIYESFIDPHTQLPVKSIRNVKEGRYKRYNEVLFDHKSRPDSSVLTSDRTGVHIAPPEIHDILSCFYYFRNQILPNKQSFEQGEIITINTWFTDELYPIRLKYIEKEEVRLGKGKIMCYKFNPVTEKGRLFESEEDVTFWFSADKNYLPVKIRFNIFVGSFNVELERFEGLAYPLEIKEK